MTRTGHQTPRRRRPKILLVDDQPALRRLLAVTLGTSGAQLLEAASGDQGLALARAERPEIVLLDVMLPGVDGFEVCRRIKADPATAGTKVVMLTASSDLKSRKRGEEVGADAYLGKPFSPLQLLKLIDDLLEMDLMGDLLQG